MIFYPSIGDIVLICGKVHDITTNFKQAPSEFKDISLEIEDLHSVLEDIKVQSQRSWSPLARDEKRARTVKRCLALTDEHLQELQGALERYNSLGSDSPKLAERARYITENFDRIREKLRQRRKELDTQLSLSNVDVLGRILKIVHKRVQDERNGNRRSVICGSEDSDVDAFTVVSQDLQRQNVPKQEIEAYKPDIEAYIGELRQIGGLERPQGSELGPNDSISQVELEVNVATLAAQTSSSLKPAPSNLVAQFRGEAIREVSYRTIFNPHVKPNMVRKPNTFDVWGLAAKCLSLQQMITRDLFQIPEDERIHFSSILDVLSYFEPFLILTLADSSTDYDFWSRMHAVREYETIQGAKVFSKNTGDNDYRRNQENVVDPWPHNLPFDKVGEDLLNLLIAIHNEHEDLLVRSQSHDNGDDARAAHTQASTRTSDDECKASVAPPPLKRESRFLSILPLRKPKSTGSNRSTMSNSISPVSSQTFENEQMPGEARRSTRYPPISINGRTFKCPRIWDEALKQICSTYIGTVAGSNRMTRSGFESDLQEIRKRWELGYKREREIRSLGLETEENSLLVEWLLSIQALDFAKCRGLSALSQELSFPYACTDRLRHPSGVHRYGGEYYDARTGGCYINPGLADWIKIYDKAIYAHKLKNVVTRYPYNVLEVMKRDLPDGWEARLTDVGDIYYVHHNSNTAQRERPAEDDRIDGLTVCRSVEKRPQVDIEVPSAETSVESFCSSGNWNPEAPAILS